MGMAAVLMFPGLVSPFDHCSCTAARQHHPSLQMAATLLLLQCRGPTAVRNSPQAHGARWKVDPDVTAAGCFSLPVLHPQSSISIWKIQTHVLCLWNSFLPRLILLAPRRAGCDPSWHLFSELCSSSGEHKQAAGLPLCSFSPGPALCSTYSGLTLTRLKSASCCLIYACKSAAVI